MSYMFETKVHGIPCICDVQAYVNLGKEDYFDFNILDRKGYRAPWLTKYLTKADSERLLEEYQFEVMAEQAGIYTSYREGWDS